MNGEIIEYDESKFIKPKEDELIKMPDYRIDLKEYLHDVKSWDYFIKLLLVSGFGIAIAWIYSLQGTFSANLGPLMIIIVTGISVVLMSAAFHNARREMLSQLTLVGLELHSERKYKKLNSVKEIFDKYSGEEYGEERLQT